jgi:hypothetical protein
MDIPDTEIGYEKFQGKKHQTCQIEHMEEWPGGRYNHYIFDLNRDWAWQTQAESQQLLCITNGCKFIQMYMKWGTILHILSTISRAFARIH